MKKSQPANAQPYAYAANANKAGWTRDSQARPRLVDSPFCITCSLENNAFSVLHYVISVALHHSNITLCDIDSWFFLPLEQSRTALLGCRLAALRRREAARWQLEGGSCNLQPCFRGGSVIFVLKGGSGPYVFSQPHFQMLRSTPPPHPILFD